MSEAAFRRACFVETPPWLMRWWPGASRTWGLARTALHHFLTLAPERIEAAHWQAMARCLRWTGGDAGRWLRPVRILNRQEALADAGLQQTMPALAEVLAACQDECVGLNWVRQAATGGACVLPSPFAVGQQLRSQDSHELDKGLNALRFVDAQARQSVFVLQNISSADSLYLPQSHVLIYLAHARQADVRSLWQALFTRLAAWGSRSEGARVARRWGGVLVSNHRPGHFFYENLSALVKLAQDEALAASIPALIQREDHDFYDLAPVFPAWPHRRCSRQQLIEASQQGTWFVHLGDNPHQRAARTALYDTLDARLMAHAQAHPTAAAREALAALDGAQPILWVGIEGQKRCWLEQEDGLARLVQRLARRHPRLGVVIDGWTLPLTPGPRNQAEAQTDRAIAQRLRERLPSGVCCAVLVGADSATKLSVAARVDFFVTNFAGGSLHVSRLARRPGVAHLSQALGRHSVAEGVQLHPHPDVRLLPLRWVTDRPAPSSSQEMAALSYSITPEALCDFVVPRFEASLTPPKAPAPVRLFLELPFGIDPAAREAFRRACLGRMVEIFPTLPGADRLATLADEPAERWQRTWVYGLFPANDAAALPGPHEWWLWLGDPLVRAQLHTLQFMENARQQGQHLSVDEVLSAGHRALDNHLTRFLSGQDAPFGACGPTMLAAAMARLTRDVRFIGWADAWAESVQRLCALLDWDADVFPVELPALHVPPGAFTPAQTERLRAMVQLDTALCAAARRLVPGCHNAGDRGLS